MLWLTKKSWGDFVITISLCMIVKDEEQVIGRALDSVKDIVDEIIIVDTGSTDRTKEIVREYTTEVYDFPWINDFSAARNFAFSKATKDYILWLDADDVILKEDRMKFKELKQTLAPSVDVVMMKYNVGFDNLGNVTMSYYRERLVKRVKNFQWREVVHEYLEIYGEIINVDIAITHQKEKATDANRNINIYEDMLAKGIPLTTRSQFYYANELFYNQRYADAIQQYTAFLDSEKGWVEDNITACYHMAKSYLALKDRKNCLKALLRSFTYDNPRAEICCMLGDYYASEKAYEKAILWYKLATELKKPADNWGFLLHDCWGYLPNIQLCLCYYQIGNIEKAMEHNNRAAAFKPNDPAVLHNQKFFKAYLNQESSRR